MARTAAEFVFPEKCFSATEGSSSANTVGERKGPSNEVTVISRPSESDIVSFGSQRGCKEEKR